MSSLIANIDSRVTQSNHSNKEDKHELTPKEVDVNGQRVSVRTRDSDHCINVKDGKERFDGGRPLDMTSQRHKTQPRKQVSVFEIFSGTAEDHDIPHIEDDVLEDGVYPRDDRNRHPASREPQTTVGPPHHKVSESKKPPQKSPSYSNRKSAMKKGSVNFRSVSNDSERDHENDGVIIRLKDQESYYDTKDKYHSVLPDVGPLPSCKRPRRSLMKDRAVDQGSLDLVEEPYIRGDGLREQSILLRDTGLPPADDGKVEDDGEGEDDVSSDLEPTGGDLDSLAESRHLLRLMSEGPQRIRWAETEEGRSIVAMRGLSEEVIRWQEAQFEVITSEASYYRSLELLVNKIYKSPLMACVGERRPQEDGQEGARSPVPPAAATTLGCGMQPIQKHHLFSNLLEIHISSGELLRALETRWRESPFIEDLSDIIVDFSRERLRPYITYLRNQQYQTATYNQLLTQPQFLAALRSMEADPDCSFMNLGSLLLLPMQRLMRLKLLFTVVRKYTPEGYPLLGCDKALEALEQLLKESSEQKVLMEQKEEIMKIINRLVFKKHAVRNPVTKGEKEKISIGNKPLLKEGVLKVFGVAGKACRSLGAASHLYLFEDQLILSQPQKKRGMCLSVTGDKEVVEDICPRDSVRLECGGPLRPLITGRVASGNQLRLVLEKGLRGHSEYICEPETREEVENWMNAFSPEVNDWEEFEFDRVIVTEDYIPKNPSELPLKKNQILEIKRRLDDRRLLVFSGDCEGEVFVSHVKFSCPRPQQSTPPPSPA